MGPRAGYVVDVDSLQRWALSKGRILPGKVPGVEGTPEAAVFVESGQFLPFDEQFLPTPPLPSAHGTPADLIRYAETLQVLTKAALAEARRKLRGTDGENDG